MLPWFLLKLQSETHDYSGESFVFWGFFPCVCKSPQHLFYSSHHVSCTELNLNNGGKKKRDARGAVSTALWQNPNNGTRDEISDEIFNRSSYLDCSSEISPLLNCEKKSKHGLEPLA